MPTGSSSTSFLYYPVRGPTGPSGSSGGWSTTGNAGTVSGTAGSSTAGTNYIGTTNAENLEVRLDGSTSTFFRFTQGGALEMINPDVNTFVGLSAGVSNSGNNNVAVGASALAGSNSGGSNTALGSSAMLLNETGSQNCAMGQSALLFNRTGGNNVAIGYFALRSNQNSDSTAMGTNTLQSNFEGERNTAVGSQSLTLNSSGSNNTCIGYHTMYADVSGSQNTSVGSESFTHAGNYITCVGYGSDIDADGLDNASAFGYGAIATASNQVVIGNTSVTSIGGYANWSNLSDARFKTNVQENVSGLAFVQRLRPVTYQLDMTVLDKNNTNTNTSNQGSILKTGLIAQEVESAAAEIGYEFDGIVRPQSDADHYRLTYSSFVMPLIKAVQEQQQMIEALQQKVAELRK